MQYWEVDLVGVDLVGVDLVGADLVGVDLVGGHHIFNSTRIDNLN